MKIFQFAFTLLWLTVSASAFAVDYDFEAARRVWEDRQSQLNRAESELAREEAALRPLVQRQSNAESEVNRLTASLQTLRAEQHNLEIVLSSDRASLTRLRNQRDTQARDLTAAEDEVRRLIQRKTTLTENIEQGERDIEQIDRRIRQLENQPNDGLWTCLYVDHGTEEHRGGHPASDLDRATANQAANDACVALHGRCDFVRCTQPDSSELARLRVERRNKADDIDAKKQTLAQVNRDLTNAHSTAQSLRNAIVTSDQNILSLEQRIQGNDTRLINIRYEINTAETRLDQARDVLAEARSARDRQQIIVDRAAGTRDQAYRDERSANSYYQTVLNNYQGAYNAAVTRGHADGNTQGNREALERAAPVGRSAGSQAGTRTGADAGLSDSRVVSGVRGYNHGLASGSTDAGLNTSYQRGVTAGASLAQSKAQAEDFPQSYNLRINDILSVPPSSEETHDISVELPNVQGPSGPLVDPRPKPIGHVNAPSYVNHTEPGINVPSPGSPSISVPGVDQRYFSPNCFGEPLPVFNQACADSYAESYQSGYISGYYQQYSNAYASEFATASDSAYRSARQTEHPAVFSEHANVGAENRGILNGFSMSLADARNEATRRGILAVATLRERGFLPLLRSVSLEQAVDDGNVSPGEGLKVKVVVDNYGLKNAAHENLRIRLASLANANFAAEVRTLPAISADTRVILEGVLSGAAGENLGSLLKVKAVLEEVQPDGTAITLDEAIFESGVRLPIELNAITFDAPLQIGAEGKAKLSFLNNTDGSFEALTLPLTISGDGLTTTATDVVLPELGAGETATVDVPVVATEFASTSVPVVFKLTAGSVAGSSPITIVKEVGVPVVRVGQLDLCMPRCGEAVNFPLRVRAGGVLSLRTQFRFTGTRAGSFQFGKLAVSDSRITGVSGGTVGVGPGEWGPTSPPYSVTFGYVFPIALRGETHWITLYLKAGGNRIQTLKVPVIVE